MNLLFFAVFLLFSLLVLRLGVVQIVSGEEYKKEVERTEDVVVDTSVPRGKIYDRYGNVVVDNLPLNAITYTRTQSTSQEEMLKVAEQLSTLIEKETKEVTERDKKDFWIMKHPEEAEGKVTEKERQKLLNNEELSEDQVNSEIYQLTLDRISEKEINSLTAEDIEVLAIYREFTSGYALVPQIVKNKDVTKEEFARVSEHLQDLPGINTTTDWERTYAFDKTLRSILGNVSSSREGLPSNLVDYYIAQGYKRNDRVGKSYIELQYEDVLQGQKEKIKNITKDGSVLDSKLIQEGQRGKDLVLTIDMELQQEIEKIVEEELKKTMSRADSPYTDRAFFVLMDPNTGDILAMVGKKYAKNPENGKYEIQDYALGTFTSSYIVGSAAKGATVLTGYMTDNLTPGEHLIDEPLYIKGTPKKGSWFNKYGPAKSISDVFALEKSSNAYMWKLALRIAGAQYTRNEPINNYDPGAFTIMRNHFAQFGLGVPTGIDLPGEFVGYKGNTKNPGYLLDFAIGQYDTYTPMQLAQYVSVIANGGARIQPHVMKEVREPVSNSTELGPIIYEKEVNVLNRINATQNEIKQVQKGFYQVFHGSDGTAADAFHDAEYVAAGKSGTAEAFYYDPETKKNKETYNTTLIGYAPYNNPEVAFSTVIPYSHQTIDPAINEAISRRALDKYFELKKKRAKQGLDQSKVTKKVENLEKVEEIQEAAREENE
ncbi:peptidoglycan D,D-transpeptidase FtsI family protein [Bacillus pakistanensis]